MCMAQLVYGQYYLRGEVIDNKGNLLPNTKIFLHSARIFYITDASGSFGFPITHITDTVTLSRDGFNTEKIVVNAMRPVALQMKPSAAGNNKSAPKLSSLTENKKRDGRLFAHFDNETYFQLAENENVLVKDYPNTSFSLNVNKASYSNVRRFLNMKSKVPVDAVRVEELINYFNLQYKEPAPGNVFRIESQLSSCPWNANKNLLFVNVSAKKLDLGKTAPGNFVFLIDVSGSMDMPNRLPLLKAAFQLFVKNLRPVDKVSIVIYGGSVGIWLDPTSGANKEKIIQSIEELEASGDTPGESAIRAAYTVAEKTFIEGGTNRVILATDGDFNVGETSEKDLEELITKKKQSGVYLTCLGVGMGNFKDSKLQALAKKGNGNYAYLDDINEAQKVLVKELTQTMYGVADDVSMQLEFNPAAVKEYRLIGFDNRRDAIADDKSELEGGDIGSGNSTLAIFEILPADTAKLNTGNIIASIKLKYNCGNDTLSHMLRYTAIDNYKPIDDIDKELKFASAVAMFGLTLRNSVYIHQANWPLIKAIAQSSANESDFLQQQFVKQVLNAEMIYSDKLPARKKGRRKAAN